MNEYSSINISGSDEDVARWIWKTLVPKSGPALYLQAELLRAIERLRWEAQENGNINWGEGFELFIELIESTLIPQSCFSEEVKQAIRKDLDRLKNFLPPGELIDDDQKAELPYVADDLYDRLVGHLITYCRHSPQLMPYQCDPRQYM